MTRATLNKRIDAFLKDQKKSTGGYAPVDPTEIDALHVILNELLALKYQKDPDGDLPVRASLTDLTRYQAPYFPSIPHVHERKNGKSPLEMHQDALYSWLTIASMASKEAQSYAQAVQSMLREDVGLQRPLEIGGVRYVAKPPKNLTVRDAADALQLILNQTHRKEPCPVDYEKRNAWINRVAEKAGKKLGIKVTESTCIHTVEGVRGYFDVPAFDSSIRVDSNAEKGQALIIDYTDK